MLQDSKAISNSNVSNGFFGKLPGFPDFIKYNAAGKEILTIDNWLQEGLALAKLKYKNQWKDYYNNSLILNFIYPFTGTDNTTIGVISPSNDKSGRSFPFLMFKNIKKNLNDSSSFYLVPSAYNEIFQLLTDIIDENKFTEDTSGLKSLTDNLKFSDMNTVLVADIYNKFINETKLCDVLLSGDDNQIDLNDLFDDYLKIFEHFICFRYSTEFDLPNTSFLVSYYIQLLQNIFKKSDTSPGIFWTRMEDNSILLFIIFSKPSPKDFIDLLFYNRTSMMASDEKSLDNKKEFYSANSVFRNNSKISTNISLSKFLNSIRNYLN